MDEPTRINGPSVSWSMMAKASARQRVIVPASNAPSGFAVAEIVEAEEVPAGRLGPVGQRLRLGPVHLRMEAAEPDHRGTRARNPPPGDLDAVHRQPARLLDHSRPPKGRRKSDRRGPHPAARLHPVASHAPPRRRRRRARHPGPVTAGGARRRAVSGRVARGQARTGAGGRRRRTRAPSGPRQGSGEPVGERGAAGEHCPARAGEPDPRALSRPGVQRPVGRAMDARSRRDDLPRRLRLGRAAEALVQWGDDPRRPGHRQLRVHPRAPDRRTRARSGPGGRGARGDRHGALRPCGGLARTRVPNEARPRVWRRMGVPSCSWRPG